MAIGSWLRRHWIEIAWGAFSAANVGVVLVLRNWVTIPFHLVWVSLTIVYGLRVWRLRSTILLAVVVCVLTGLAIWSTVTRHHQTPDELAEVPLMAAMFVAMVWHARRRQAAMEEVRRLAESEHRLLEAQREFVRDASHELRTPITVARGHAELIRSMTRDPQVAADADVVVDELGRLSRLSERLLILAAAEHPGFLDPRPVAVERLPDDTIRRWQATADRRWRALSGVRGTVSADRERLEVALDCLIDNAVKFTSPKDSIEVVTRSLDGSVVIEVRDSGRGIDASRLPRMFERFSRADVDRGRPNGGTGLGLAIVKAIAEAHGGTVEAESVVGAGTTVRLKLPGLAPRSEPDRGAQPEPADQAFAPVRRSDLPG